MSLGDPVHPEIRSRRLVIFSSLPLDQVNDLISFGKIFEPQMTKPTKVIRFILDKWQEWYHQQIENRPEELQGWKFAPEEVKMFRTFTDELEAEV